jgi:hypothetical protein
MNNNDENKGCNEKRKRKNEVDIESIKKIKKIKFKIEKKINLFFNDLKIIFENKKFFNFKNDSKKLLILKLKNKISEKKKIFKQDLIGCGGYFSFIYNQSINLIYFILFFK